MRGKFRVIGEVELARAMRLQAAMPAPNPLYWTDTDALDFAIPVAVQCVVSPGGAGKIRLRNEPPPQHREVQGAVDGSCRVASPPRVKAGNLHGKCINFNYLKDLFAYISDWREIIYRFGFSAVPFYPKDIFNFYSSETATRGAGREVSAV